MQPVVRALAASASLLFLAILDDPAFGRESALVAPDVSRQLRLEIQSDVLGETRFVDIYLPKAYARTSDAFPVVYVLDGEESFHYAAGVLDALYQRGFPPAILVAVPNTQRGRDLTPEPWGETPSGGGADAFLDFFEQELKPELAEHVRLQSYSVLVGHSYGGLFAVHALAMRPELFDAYIAISPSMHYAEGRSLEVLSASLDREPHVSRTLYIAMGAEPGEEGDSVHQLYSLVAERAPADVSWDFQLFPEEDHSTVPVVATLAGLRYVFKDFVLEGAELPRSVDDVVRHYEAVSEKFGWAVRPPQRVLINLGFGQLAANDIEGAIRTFSTFTDTYPTMIIGWDALAEAQLHAGDRAAAIAALEQLLQVAPDARDARLRLDALRAENAE